MGLLQLTYWTIVIKMLNYCLLSQPNLINTESVSELYRK